METTKIWYCGEKIVPLIDKERIGLVISITGYNRKYLEENNINHTFAATVENFWEEQEDVDNESIKLLEEISKVDNGIIIVHCQLGQSRSKALANALAKCLGHNTVGYFYKYRDNPIEEYTYNVDLDSHTAEKHYNSLMKVSKMKSFGITSKDTCEKSD